MATQVSDTSGKTKLRGGSADELSVIAQRAQAFTNASGTAIALSEGSVDEIVCRARSGSNAPEVGTSLRVEGSFTGLCIQSGKELRCDDAETDTRVDTTAIRALGIRSMVVIPIKQDGRVVGVLAVFAPTAHAFTITHVAVLKTMADQIAALLQRQRTGRDDSELQEPVRPAPSVSQARPAAVSASSSQALPPGVVIKPAAPRPQLPVVPKVEPVKAAVVAPEIPPPLKRKKAEEQPESKSDYRINFGTLDAAGGLGKKLGGHVHIIGIAAVVIVATAGGVTYLKLKKPVAPEQHIQDASVAPVNAQPATPVVASGTVATTTAVVTPSNPAPASVDTNKKPDKNSTRGAAASLPQVKHEEVAVRHEELPPPREETVALSTGPSRISGARDNASSGADAAPTITVSGGSDSGSLSTLANPVAVSTPSMVAQSDLEQFKVLKRVTPIYPAIAKQRMLSGSVVVKGVIDVNGKIKDLQLVSGPPIFRDAAFDALKQWEFKPARLNGQPIEQQTTVRLDFSPAR